MTQRFAGLRSAIVCAALAAFGITHARAANPATGLTSTGQTLNIRIDSPADASTVAVGPVAVTGRTAIGELTVNAAVVYVVDVSGSTAGPTGMDCNGDGVVNAADDINGDGGIGSTLDCEISGVFALNRSLANTAGVSAGAISFSDTATALDVDPSTAGNQAFTPAGADLDNNGVRDVEQGLRPLRPLASTNFDAAITAMNKLFATRPAGEQHVGFFLSDGIPTSFTSGAGSPLAQAQAAGTHINTYSVGAAGAGCGNGSALRIIADATGGTCTAVTHPASIVAVLSGAMPTGIGGVTLAVDGGAPVSASLDALGNFNGVINLGPGSHTISSTVTTTDATTVTATISLFGAVTTPDPFHFVDQFDVPAATMIVSAPIALSGSNVPTMISANGGEYSINGGVFTSMPGMVPPEASVRARVTSNATPGAAAHVTVTIGGVSDDFDVTTRLPVTTKLVATANVSALNPGTPLGLSLRFEGTLTIASSGAAVVGQPVVFTTKLGQTCTGTTNGSGVARCSFTLQSLIGTVLGLGFDARYAGAPAYLPSSAHGVLVRALGIGLF